MGGLGQSIPSLSMHTHKTTLPIVMQLKIKCMPEKNHNTMVNVSQKSSLANIDVGLVLDSPYQPQPKRAEPKAQPLRPVKTWGVPNCETIHAWLNM